MTYLHCWHGSLQIDAAIVRIMKTRKVLSHTLLITELFQQVNPSSLSVLKFISISIPVYPQVVPCRNNVVPVGQRKEVYRVTTGKMS